jgi:peptidoglycan pentaglycine glycine transferase (the first glycine)
MSSPCYHLHLISTTRQEQWDEFVTSHPNGHLLQSWGWGELKAGAGWSPLRFALFDANDQQGQIRAAAQVLCRTMPHLPLRIGHLAYIPKGPVVDWSQPQVCQALFAQLNVQLRRRGALALQIEPQQEVGVATDDCLVESFSSLSLYPVPAIQPVRTILLDLTPDEPTLLANMKEKWRYNLRLAQRKGVTIRVAQTPEDVQAWYTLLQTTGLRDQFGIHTLDYYMRVWQIFTPRSQVRLLLAEIEGQLLAGIFVGLMAKQAIYLYGASSNEQRNLMPNYLLQWEAMRWAKQAGATCYDFWGIPATEAEGETLAGVYRFKQGWGGRIVRFVGGYEHVYRPMAMGMARRLMHSSNK